MSPPSMLASLLSYFSPSLAVLLLLAFFTLFSSSAADGQYAHHCGHLVPESEASKLYVGSQSISLRRGYFLGGDGLFSSVDESTVFYPPSFDLISQSIHKTRSLDILKIKGTLSLYGAFHNWTQYNRRFHWSPSTSVEEATFDLSGYWSESTGMLCMVGAGIFHKAEGKYSHRLSAVLKLKYPKISTLHTSLVNGTVDIKADSPNQADQISLFAYAKKSYKFTMIPQAKRLCSSTKLEDEIVDMEPTFACSSLHNRMFRIVYKNDCTGSSCRTSSTSLGLSYKFLSLEAVQCLNNGSTQVFIELSNSSRYVYYHTTIPGKSLVGEGYWDSEMNRFCIIACMLEKNSSVGECNIGLSLWFPGVVTLRNRSDVVGSIWSNKNKNDENYFEIASIQSSGGWAWRGQLHGKKYKYTELNSVRKSCQRNKGSKQSHERRYPRAKSLAGMTFGIYITDDRHRTSWGQAKMLAVEDEVYGKNYEQSYLKKSATEIAAKESLATASNNSMWNVSYSIVIDYRYSSFSSSDDEEDKRIEIAAEGLYNDETGYLCMKGCQNPQKTKNHGAVLDSDSPDCEILINIQLPPLHPEVEMHINGSIASTRKNSDPLYFKTKNFSSNHMYISQVGETIWRMDIEIIMGLISLTISSLSIALQIFHVKKHPGILPSVSITMLLVLALGCMIPLVLNIEAVFMNARGNSVLLQHGRWLNTNEVIVRIISMIAFFLSLRLIQLAWSARTEEGRNYWTEEKATIKLCLPLYCTGGLITWLVYSRWQALISYSGFVLDGFLLPQIVLNICRNSKDKVLVPFFYVGIMVTRALPHLYDAYRARHHALRMKSTYIYGSHERDFYSMAWDIIIPCQGFLLASLIYLQQRFGGGFFVPGKFSNRYQAVPAELSL